MTTNELLTILISCSSIAISIASLIMTKLNMSKIEKISYGQAELAIRESISAAKNRLTDTMTVIDDNKYKNQIIEVYVEELLNAYEEACAKYIDRKIDKVRFKKMYFDELKNIVESKNFERYFMFGSKYEAIKKVYNEWFDLENIRL